MDGGPPGSSVRGMFQARILEWASLPPPGGLPAPGMESRSPASFELDLYPVSHRGRSFHDAISLIYTWELQHACLVDRYFKLLSASQMMKKKKVPFKQ